MKSRKFNLLSDIYELDNNIIGIYCLLNNVNRKFYIGSSKNIRGRLIYHKNRLKNNNHYNKTLQRSINKYGLNNFLYTIVYTCTNISNLYKVEQKYLNILKSKLNESKFACPASQYKYKGKLQNMISESMMGIKNVNAKLTKEQVLEIRSSDEKGIVLAKRFNLSTSQISMVRNYLSYKNI